MGRYSEHMHCCW